MSIPEHEYVLHVVSVMYLTLPYLRYCNCYRMLGYGTGTGTGTVREGKGRYTGYLF